jgi:serine/threonine protein kinase
VEGSEYDEKIDIWALGVLLYELSSGHAPFQTKDENVTYHKIVNSECKYPQHFSKALRELISRILDKRPSNRPSLSQI